MECSRVTHLIQLNDSSEKKGLCTAWFHAGAVFECMYVLVCVSCVRFSPILLCVILTNAYICNVLKYHNTPQTNLNPFFKIFTQFCETVQHRDAQFPYSHANVYLSDFFRFRVQFLATFNSMSLMDMMPDLIREPRTRIRETATHLFILLGIYQLLYFAWLFVLIRSVSECWNLFMSKKTNYCLKFELAY